MSRRSFTALLFSLLLLHLFPFCTLGNSLISNATQFNSSKDATNLVGLKPALTGNISPVSSSQIHVHNLHATEETGSSGQDENRPYVRPYFAEQEHQTDMAIDGMAAGLPTKSHSKAQLDFKEENTEDLEPHWYRKILQPDGSILNLESHSSSHEQSLFLSETADSSPIVKVSFSEPDQHYQIEIPPQEAQGGDPTSWTFSDFYDYLSPEYSTTESYTDDDDHSIRANMEEGNLQLAKESLDNAQSLTPDDGANGVYALSRPSGDADRVDNDGCLLGFVYRNGTCQSPCNVYTNYCFNGGQCYVVEGVGAFCRCNIQDYMWNKGTRCESVITDFQVMCIVVSSVSITLFVLFMVIVVFSKRLHVLTTENRQLRKRSKTRPQSEQPVDNFSLSTIADGSQANKTMNKYSWECKPIEASCSENDNRKPEETLKDPVKKEESLNIQNTLTPEQENTTISTDDPEEVNSLKNIM